jgi:hypothetical protein
MIKLSLMISNMSFVTNGWYLPHHVLNDYCPKKFIHNNFKAITHICPFMIGILVINLVIYLKISTSVNIFLMLMLKKVFF